MLALALCRDKMTFHSSLRAGEWEWESDIWSQRHSPSRSRAADAVRHPSQKQMVLTVGTLSVPKDTQSPAGFPPASSLLDNAPVLKLLG